MGRAGRFHRAESDHPVQRANAQFGGIMNVRRIGIMLVILLVTVAVATGTPAAPVYAAPCDPPIANPVVCENSKAGTPVSEWDINGAGDTTIQGFGTDISVNRGATIAFKIKSTAANYRLDIY